MIGKNNLNERLHKTMVENKNDRFSIRKLAVGVASVLLGFSFMAANGQMVKADTVEPSGQASGTTTNKQGAESTTIPKDQKTATDAGNKAKADVTTYSGLHSFLRDDTEQAQTNKIAAKSKQEEDSNEQGSESAADLANAASDLQTEIGKGHNFVTTTAYQQATADKQQAVTDAITQGQATLDKYNHFVATNDEASRVSLFDLTDAKVTISAMITAATNTVSTQSFGDWTLSVSGDTLTIGGSGSNGSSGTLADAGYTGIKNIIIGSEITLNNQVNTNNEGMFGGLANLETITGLDKVNVPNGANLTGLFANDTSLKELDLTNFSMAGADAFTNMFYKTGKADGFTLTLRGIQFPAADAKLGEGRGRIKRNSDGQLLTTAQLQGFYIAGGSSESYTMYDAASDTDTYTPEELQIDLVNHQPIVDANADKFNAYDKLKFTDASHNEVTAQALKTTGKILSVEWVYDKQLHNPTDIFSKSEDSLDSIVGFDSNKSILFDNAGTLDGYDVESRNELAFPNGLQGLVKVNYADGTFVYVHVKFNVKDAELTTPDKWQAFTSSLDPISQGIVPETKFGANSAVASYVNLNGISPDQVDYYTVSNTTKNEMQVPGAAPGTMTPVSDNNGNFSYGDLKANWKEMANPSSSYTDIYTEPAVVRIHFKNGGIQDIDVPDFRIQSMANYSPAKQGLSIGTIYSGVSPVSVMQSIVTKLKAESDSANIDFNTIEWNGNPTFSPDSESASFKIGYKDGSQNNNVTVNANVIPTPPTSHADQLVKEITQGRQIVAEIEIPQYSDLVNDQTLAANVALGTNLPKGTTFAWDQRTLPDTYTKGTKATAFVIVTSPDGSIASVPVSVTIGDPVIQDIKLKHNAYLYNEYGERANGISLKAGSTVTVYGTRVIDGRKFYLTKDAAYYIAAGNDNPVTRRLDKNALTYNVKGKKVVSAKRFKGEQIQTYGIPVVIKGKEYYAIGHKRYMLKVNFPPTPEWVVPRLTKQDLADGVVQRQLKKNAFVYTDKLDRANEVVLSAGSIIQTRGTKTIGNQQYYDLGNNMYVDVRNVKKG